MSRKIVLQDLPSLETRAVRMAALMMDVGAVIVRNASLDTLGSYGADLRDGAVPIGSVEFVRSAMALAGIREPASIGYADWAMPWIWPQPRLVRASDVRERCFVKPLAVKRFTGFVFDPSTPVERLDEADAQALMRFKALPPDEPVYVRDEVVFASEWRYYVEAGRFVGFARYDQGEVEKVAEPDSSVVNSLICAGPLDRPYAADFGVLDDGRTTLVELNDFWAIGLYQRALTPQKYLEMLCARWELLRIENGSLGIL